MPGEQPPEVDLLIVGRGPAGTACALQAHRDGLRVLLAGDEPTGGLVRAARRIDNLPGSPGVTGRELAGRLDRQLVEAGVPTAWGRAASLRSDGPRFVARFDPGFQAGGTVLARAVCLATGTRPRALPFAAGREALRDARALPASLAGLSVVVVGGGEAALDTALSAQDRGAAVTVLARGTALRGARELRAEVERSGIVVRLGAAAASVVREGGRWSIRTAEGLALGADVLVACLGREPCDELWRGLAAEGLLGAVEQPAMPGVFAAGDLIRGRDRYVATAMGDGQRAALAAAAFLEGGK